MGWGEGEGGGGGAGGGGGGGGGEVPPMPPIQFLILVDHVTIFNSSPMQHLRWSSL